MPELLRTRCGRRLADGHSAEREREKTLAGRGVMARRQGVPPPFGTEGIQHTAYRADRIAVCRW
jgi:hypothetical protein